MFDLLSSFYPCFSTLLISLGFTSRLTWVRVSLHRFWSLKIISCKEMMLVDHVTKNSLNLKFFVFWWSCLWVRWAGSFWLVDYQPMSWRLYRWRRHSRLYLKVFCLNSWSLLWALLIGELLTNELTAILYRWRRHSRLYLKVFSQSGYQVK